MNTIDNVTSNTWNSPWMSHCTKGGNLIGVAPNVTHIQSFARLYCYARHYRTKPEATTGTLGPSPESLNFILLLFLHWRLQEPKIKGEFPTFSEEKGAKRASIVITFWSFHDYDTCPVNLWRMCNVWLLLECLTRHFTHFGFWMGPVIKNHTEYRNI